MKRWVFDILVCPHCSKSLLAEGEWQRDEMKDGWLSCSYCQNKWPIISGIPRFVAQNDDYCGSFGYQWKSFSRTQLDSFSGTNSSEIRFLNETGWDKSNLHDSLLLDGGCGAGRFADVALKLGARVIAIDLSAAVDACYENLNEIGHNPERYAVVQASIYELPFSPETFSGVYSLGVIQHTPARRKAVQSLARLVKNGGELALWVYGKNWKSWLQYKYWLRLFTRFFSLKTNWNLSNFLVEIFFPLAWHVNKIPLIGGVAVRLFPLAFRCPDSTNRKQSKEWTFLDTFDNLSPKYDNPIRESELRSWLSQCGMVSIERRKTLGLAIKSKKTLAVQDLAE